MWTQRWCLYFRVGAIIVLVENNFVMWVDNSWTHWQYTVWRDHCLHHISMAFSLSAVRPLQDRKAFHRALYTNYIRVTVLGRMKDARHKRMQRPAPPGAGLARRTWRWSIILVEGEKTFDLNICIKWRTYFLSVTILIFLNSLLAHGWIRGINQCSVISVFCILLRLYSTKSINK
jgi:hypothetical protein